MATAVDCVAATIAPLHPTATPGTTPAKPFQSFGSACLQACRQKLVPPCNGGTRSLRKGEGNSQRRLTLRAQDDSQSAALHARGLGCMGLAVGGASLCGDLPGGRGECVGVHWRGSRQHAARGAALGGSGGGGQAQTDRNYLSIYQVGVGRRCAAAAGAGPRSSEGGLGRGGRACLGRLAAPVQRRRRGATGGGMGGGGRAGPPRPCPPCRRALRRFACTAARPAWRRAATPWRRVPGGGAVKGSKLWRGRAGVAPPAQLRPAEPRGGRERRAEARAHRGGRKGAAASAGSGRERGTSDARGLSGG